MTTQTQSKHTLLRWTNPDVLHLGIIAGEVAALLWVGLALAAGLHGRAGLFPAAGQLLSDEVARIGGLLTAVDTPAYWYLSRGAGLVGYLLLWGSTIWGLVTTTKVAKGAVSGPFANGLHEFLSLAALGFGTLHALALLGDHYLNLSLANVIYPFAVTSYRPGWVGLGQLGFYLSIALAASFYVRKSIGPRTWRVLHYAAFLSYATVLVHGITSGTDSSTLPVQVIFVTTGTAVAFLVYYRLFTSRLKAHIDRAGADVG